jgi:hypothetical protein
MGDAEIYVLHWRRSDRPGISWYIRGLKPDGSFYGSIRNELPEDDPRRSEGAGYGASIEGVLPADDDARCREIIETIRSDHGDVYLDRCASIAVWSAPGSGPYEAPIIFLYEPGDEAHSVDARLFLELIEIVERQVTKHYGAIHASGETILPGA